MDRIIDGRLFRGNPSETRFRLKVVDLGHGHREAVVMRCVDWVEDGLLHPDSIEAQVLRGEREPDLAELEERRQASARRAARRAATNTRQRVKALGCDALLTLTYRANQQDEALCKLHLREFVRRVRRVIPGFGYVAAYERQARGAWHVHLATHRLPAVLGDGGHRVKSYNVVRAIWRSVTGELGGNIDHKAVKRRSKWSPAKLAAYLAKYMVKAFEEGEAWAKRISHSQHTLPAAVVAQFEHTTMLEMIARAYSFAAGGVARVVTAWLSGYGDVFYVATENGSA
jgi:hypothetical protein